MKLSSGIGECGYVRNGVKFRLGKRSNASKRSNRPKKVVATGQTVIENYFPVEQHVAFNSDLGASCQNEVENYFPFEQHIDIIDNILQSISNNSDIAPSYSTETTALKTPIEICPKSRDLILLCDADAVFQRLNAMFSGYFSSMLNSLTVLLLEYGGTGGLKLYQESFDCHSGYRSIASQLRFLDDHTFKDITHWDIRRSVLKYILEHTTQPQSVRVQASISAPNSKDDTANSWMSH